MPLDPAGNFSLLPSYFAEPGTTIRTDQHNPVLEDIANAMSSHLVRDGRNGMVNNLDMGSFSIRNLAPGANPTDALTVSQGVPLGSVLDYAGPTAPSGWMFCYGQAISRTTYAALYSVIGTAFGGGDGTTTFNLPDCRGRVTAGKDDMGGSDSTRLSAVFGAIARSVGGVFGLATHTLTQGQIPPHQHSGTTSHDGAHQHTVPFNVTNAGGASGSGVVAAVGGNAVTSSSGGHSHTFVTSSVGGGEAHNNTQPTIIMNKIIKVSY